MCYFPDIQYTPHFVPLDRNNDNILPSSPRRMFRLLENKHIVDEHFLGGINNMTELENTIFELIDHYPENGVSLERIFHLIEIWGGSAGRRFYMLQTFNWNEIEPLYHPFIDTFRQLNQVNEEMIGQAYKAVGDFYNALHQAHYKGMGVAFITKHARFWMHRNLPNDMLPIYDSTFSEHLMRKRSTQLRDLPDYWRAMKAKADEEHVPLTALERQLFNYWR